MSLPKLMTENDVAKQLKISPRSVKRMRADGLMHLCRILYRKQLPKISERLSNSPQPGGIRLSSTRIMTPGLWLNPRGQSITTQVLAIDCTVSRSAAQPVALVVSDFGWWFTSRFNASNLQETSND